MPSRLAELAAKMDQLNEFDREPVQESKLQSATQFAGLFAGEHVAATEFVIGAFFVIHGVSVRDLMLGLLLGNLLAVLSWTLICAPIAVRTRLTLYWYLRKIGGPGFMFIYNVANAIFYLVLAGAMIAVSATAIADMIGLPPTPLDSVAPTSAGWAAIALVLGATFTVLAVLGFSALARFATVCTPWIFIVFIAGAITTLVKLGVQPDLSNLWQVLSGQVWTGQPVSGQEQYGIWHIVFFAWFCNLAMHVGLSDMALLRYAPNHWYGFFTACGIYPGHFLAWLCSGVMVAAIGRDMAPGRMAYEALGVSGVIAVVLAGWTTANPTLYRAGLALQSITPNWPLWKVTLTSGIVTTVLACFPVFFLKLLDYLAIYGLILMPVGAIVFTEHWILPRTGIARDAAESRGHYLNRDALIVWIGTLFVAWILPLHLFYRWLPCWFLAVFSYTTLRVLRSRSAEAAGQEA
jgi:purine-cytosine permease-like protein